MADNQTKESRSNNMSRIRSSGTKPEEIVRKYLFSKGLRYRKNYMRYPGKPDIVLPKYGVVIFVNGCFWHMHSNCRRFTIPKSNEGYWLSKLVKNKLNDEKNENVLKRMGWRVLIIWECQLGRIMRNESLDRLYTEILKQNPSYNRNQARKENAME